MFNPAIKAISVFVNCKPGIIHLDKTSVRKIISLFVESFLCFHARGLKAGDFLQKGDFIGRIGNSGNSTAPNLHFHLSIPDYKILNNSNIL